MFIYSKFFNANELNRCIYFTVNYGQNIIEDWDFIYHITIVDRSHTVHLPKGINFTHIEIDLIHGVDFKTNPQRLPTFSTDHQLGSYFKIKYFHLYEINLDVKMKLNNFFFQT